MFIPLLALLISATFLLLSCLFLGVYLVVVEFTLLISAFDKDVFGEVLATSCILLRIPYETF